MRTRFTCIAIRQLIALRRIFDTILSHAYMHTSCKTTGGPRTNTSINQKNVNSYPRHYQKPLNRLQQIIITREFFNKNIVQIRVKSATVRPALYLMKKLAVLWVSSARRRTQLSNVYITLSNTRLTLAMSMIRSKLLLESKRKK